ncbi:metal-dependent hydrolase [Novosphingobium ovatum]|uniref:metal-dependent hydrolase n=1 Tax=Novosphingobium ovatum TaxID=1908523 RepID=UPI001D123B92|nr:metal-dependent hydrolase [Novosphingobium ovatum]
MSREIAPARGWWNGDPVASAWHTALSASFPRGEAYFIESLRAFAEDTPAELQAPVAQFIAQEANHSREHIAFNRLVGSAGFDLKKIDARLARFIEDNRSAYRLINLVATCALEHFTAILAHDLLARPEALAGTDPQIAALWQWHAAEEIEHKAVAYDLWRHAAAPLAPRRRYMIRCLVMLKVTRNFLRERWRDTHELMAQQGLDGWRARWALLRYLAGPGGVLRRVGPAWAGWFRPGFHPWDVDDRALIPPHLR